MLEILDPGPPSNRLEPRAKTAGRVVNKIAHLPGEFEQYILRDIISIGRLQPPNAAPTVNHGTIPARKLSPGGGIVGCVPEPTEQSRTGDRVVPLCHRVAWLAYIAKSHFPKKSEPIDDFVLGRTAIPATSR